MLTRNEILGADAVRPGDTSSGIQLLAAERKVKRRSWAGVVVCC